MNDKSYTQLPTLKALAKLNISVYYPDGIYKTCKEILNEIHKKFEKIVNEGD